MNMRRVRRSELDNLIATHVVERVRHKKFTTFRLVGRPMSAFAKHFVRLRNTAYTIEHVRTPDDRDVIILQEREERPDGSFEPVGGLIISKEDLPELLRAVRLRAAESLDLKFEG